MLKAELEGTARNGDSCGAHLSHWAKGEIRPINLDAEAIQCLIDHYTKRLQKDTKAWTLTDDACEQYVCQLSAWEFELVEMMRTSLNTYSVVSGKVNLARFFNNTDDLTILNAVLNFFGYSSFEFLASETEEAWAQIAAECVFEFFGAHRCSVEGAYEGEILGEELSENEARKRIWQKVGLSESSTK